MSIYFLRHIKTTYNLENRISGSFDAEPLPDQALMFSEEYSVHFHHVISSPLKRCRATVALLPSDSYDELHFCDQLIERNVGILEGMPRDQAISEYPQLFCNGKLDVTATIPNGESVSEVSRRISSLAEALSQVSDRINVLVCSHNQTLKILYATLKGLPISNDYWRKINFPNGTVVNIEQL